MPCPSFQQWISIRFLLRRDRINSPVSAQKGQEKNERGRRLQILRLQSSYDDYKTNLPDNKMERLAQSVKYSNDEFHGERQKETESQRDAWTASILVYVQDQLKGGGINSHFAF